eukprot:756709-Hanusia_phi.AAC.5
MATHVERLHQQTILIENYILWHHRRNLENKTSTQLATSWTLRVTRSYHRDANLFYDPSSTC